MTNEDHVADASKTIDHDKEPSKHGTEGVTPNDKRRSIGAV